MYWQRGGTFIGRRIGCTLRIIQGKATVAEFSRPYDLSLSKVESWVGEAKRGMENVLWANALDVNERYERLVNDLQEVHSKAMLRLRARRNYSPYWARKRSDRDDRQRLKENGFNVLIFKLYSWFNIPRRTVYYTPIKSMIERWPFFGCRTGAI